MFQTFLLFTLLAQAPDATAIQVAPSVLTEINLGRLKGTRIRQLAWSPDRSELYLMTYEPNRDASIKEAFHFVIAASNGGVKRVDKQPEWAAAYWTWKSAQMAPGDPSLKIDASPEKRRTNAVGVPFGGNLARPADTNATGTSVETAVDASLAGQVNDVYIMRLKSEVVGEWINHPIVPGQTFSWGPKGSGLIAFADQPAGRLVFMDRTGRKHKLEGSRGVTVPAWSDDGSHIAFLEPRGRNRYALFVGEVRGIK